MDDSISLIFNNAIQKIFNQSSRKNTALREACKTAQDTIRDSPIFAANSSSQHDKITDKDWDLLGNKLVLPMKLACETKEPKLMTMALDSLEKLMSYGIIKPTVLEDVAPPSGGERRKLMERVVEIIGNYFDYQDENVQLQIIKSLLTSVITPTCDIHDTCLMGAIRTCYNIYLVSTNKINSTAAKSALFQMVDSVLQRFESQYQARVASSTSHPTVPRGAEGEEGNHHYQVCLSDVILLFRAFCKLSTKDVPEGSALESHEMKSKILSLELLSRILENPLPSLKMSEKFIHNSIKRYLSVSLLSNGASNNLPEFKLTLGLFLSLIVHFKEHLKEEIGLFFSKVLLATLASPNSSVKRKWLVLPVLHEICKNPQTIVDIFVNYDSEPHKDIFEKMVYQLSRVAQGTSHGDQRSSNTSAEDAKFKSLGLECIVTIMKSLVDWSKEIYDENKKIEQARAANILLEEVEIPPSNGGDSSDGGNSPLKSSMDETQIQQLMEQGKQKFNNDHPKKGIDFLIQCGCLKQNPNEVSVFLKSNDLDIKKVGEYLCINNSFNISVLYKYIEAHDFKQLEIDQALQMVLSCFALNGESKTMDRVIEKFAEKYFNDNSIDNSIFSNAESAYLLCYAIIILSTDLHNPSIKSKLTKEEWLKMNSKANNKNDFDPKYLLDVYERVSKESYKLGYTLDEKDTSILDSQEKLLRFNRESDYIVKQCQELIKSKLSKKSTFYRARNIEHVRPMFLQAWCYVLSTLSVILDDTKDRKIVQLCLDGFSYAIRVSCIFYMNVERSSFITSLSKLCILDTIREPNIKNIDCIKALVSIGGSEGSYLQDSWSPIIKTICILERLHLVDSSTSPSPHKPLSGGQSPTNTSPSLPFPSVVEYSQNSLQYRIKLLTEEYPKDLVFDSALVERIFTNSIYLSDDSIVTFIRCLVEVSEDEILHYSHIYSMIKLVEVIECNLKRRIRLVFHNIWEIAVSHFTKIGQHANNEISQHAINSLRQLATKYLERDEMSNYNFQHEFLVPFERIMQNNPSVQIRELIVRCIGHLVATKSNHIKSGWKTMLNALSIASTVLYEPIVQLAYNTVESIANTHILQSKNASNSLCIDVVQCIGSFSLPTVHYNDICLKSLNILEAISKDHPQALHSILYSFTYPVIHESDVVRNLASSLLFSTISKFAQTQSTSSWSIIINQILLPIFRFKDQKKPNDVYNNNLDPVLIKQLPNLFNDMIQLLANYHEQLNQFYSTIINLIESYIFNNNQTVSYTGVDNLSKFIQKCGVYFTKQHWDQISDSIGRIIQHLLVKASPNNTTPIIYLFTEVSLKNKEYKNSTHQEIYPQVATHNWNLMITLMQKMTTVLLENYDNISLDFSNQIVKYWGFVYKLSKQIEHIKHNDQVPNSNSNNSGENNSETQPTNITPIQQQQQNHIQIQYETQSLSHLLKFLFEMYLNQKHGDRQSEINLFLNSLIMDIFRDTNTPNKVLLSPMVLVIKQIVDNLIKYNTEQFQLHFPSLFPLVIDMSINDNADLRNSLIALLNRFGKESIPMAPEIIKPAPLPLEPCVTTTAKQQPVNQQNLLFSPVNSHLGSSEKKEILLEPMEKLNFEIHANKKNNNSDSTTQTSTQPPPVVVGNNQNTELDIESGDIEEGFTNIGDSTGPSINEFEDIRQSDDLVGDDEVDLEIQAQQHHQEENQEEDVR